ncbi:MAG: hypothetical protein E7068_05075 [Lentimicrobiaceae bacterium]|nr:hypothetical protein [Lentimicrobiaceae bacterium]
MKNFFLLILFFISAIAVNAQKDVVVETFDDNSYGWSENGNKKSMSYISDGALNLKMKRTKKNKNTAVKSWAQLPVNYKEDFAITYKISFDKWIYGRFGAFAIYFDIKENGKYNELGIVFNSTYFVSVIGQEPEIVKFNFGNITDYEIKIVKKGNTIDFIINGMELSTVKNIDIQSNWFGIGYSTSLGGFSKGGVLSLEEIVIEQ